MIKLKVFICFFICYIIQSVFCICPAPSTPNIYKLANYINAWKKIRICDKIANVEAIIDSTGRWYITIRVTDVQPEGTSKYTNFTPILFDILTYSSYQKHYAIV